MKLQMLLKQYIEEVYFQGSCSEFHQLFLKKKRGGGIKKLDVKEL